MAVLNPVMKPVFGSAIRGVFDTAGGDPLAFHALTHNLSTFELLGVGIGIGDLQEGNSSTRYYADFEKRWRSFGNAVPGWYGARKVENGILESEDISDAEWIVSSATVSDAITISTVAASDNSLGQRYLAAYPSAELDGRSFIMSFDARSVSGSTELQGVSIRSAATGTLIASTTITLTGTTERYSIAGTRSGSLVETLWVIFGGFNTWTVAGVYEITNIQFEESTGRTDLTTPSEYIPTTTAPVTKLYANENGNTVASNVVTEATGTVLTELPWLVGQKASTNSQIYSHDLTNVEWTDTNVTVAFDETGMTGSANDASTLTATAANGTVIANIITDLSDNQLTRWFIKRKTGTGVVEITVDGGSTWQDVTTEVDSTVGFNECLEDNAALADPQIGIRLVTDTDAVIVGNAEALLGDLEAEVRQSSPIFTAGATGTINGSALSLDKANHDDAQGAYYAEYKNVGILGTSGAGLFGFISGRLVYTNTAFVSWDGSFSSTTISAGFALDGRVYKLGSIYDAAEALKTMTFDGNPAESAYDGTWGAGTQDLALMSTTTLGIGPPLHTMLMRDLRRYDSEYASGLSIIAGLGA